MSDYGSTPPPPPGGGYPPPPGGYAPPPPSGPGGYGTPPPNYLVWAILSTIFCCLPLGIASIVFAAQVNSKWQAGDVAGAQESSRRARFFAILSAVVAIPLAIGIILLQVVAVRETGTM